MRRNQVNAALNAAMNGVGVVANHDEAVNRIANNNDAEVLHAAAMNAAMMGADNAEVLHAAAMNAAVMNAEAPLAAEEAVRVAPRIVNPADFADEDVETFLKKVSLKKAAQTDPLSIESTVMEGIKIGADPELFLYDEKNNKVISSVGLIPGEKGNPWRDESWPEGFGLEIDNILAEYNIPPCATRQEWIDANNFMKNEIVNFIKKKDENFSIRHRASYLVDEDQLQTPVAKLFGCSIDYNAYTKRSNPKPKGESTNLRSCGFHIHVSYPEFNTKRSLSLIKYMDVYLGIPSVLIDPDTRRRELYGKAGCFRLTSYGFEYRVLSGYFLKDDTLLNFMWDGIVKSIYAWKHSLVLPDEKAVVDCINNSDKVAAAKINEEFNLVDSKYLS